MSGENLLYELESITLTLRDDLERLERLKQILESRRHQGYADVASWSALVSRIIGMMESIASHVRRGDDLQASVVACDLLRLIHQVEMRASTAQAGLWVHLYEELFRIPLALAREVSHKMCSGGTR